MVRHAIHVGFIEMYRMTLNDRTDFERSPKPNGTPIFCPQQILENYYFPPLKHPKRARLWGVGFWGYLGVLSYVKVGRTILHSKRL